MPKFFISNSQINDKEITIIGEDVNHIVNVLRLGLGDRVNICDISSKNNYIAEIFEIHKKNIICNIKEELEPASESNIHINIFQGLPKSDKMELIVQKGTEIGVNEITPMEMRRCVVKLDDKNKQKKVERWQKIAETAAKQSGRNTIPKINDVINIKNICNIIGSYDIVILAYEEERDNSLKGELNRLSRVLKEKCKEFYMIRIGIIIGPEGGMEKEEVEELKSAGAKVVSLGKRILRTETVRISSFRNYNV